MVAEETRSIKAFDVRCTTYPIPVNDIVHQIIYLCQSKIKICLALNYGEKKSVKK
jgi:hypothetical protein